MRKRLRILMRPIYQREHYVYWDKSCSSASCDSMDREGAECKCIPLVYKLDLDATVPASCANRFLHDSLTLVLYFACVMNCREGSTVQWTGHWTRHRMESDSSPTLPLTLLNDLALVPSSPCASISSVTFSLFWCSTLFKAGIVCCCTCLQHPA